MTKFSFATALYFCCAANAAFAENVPKGALVVRYGAANTDINYENQQGYPENLQSVSALCSQKNSNVNAGTVSELIKTDSKHPKDLKKAGGANASALINQGATVVKNPLKGNPNHCLISNISVKRIKGVWQIFSDPVMGGLPAGGEKASSDEPAVPLHQKPE